MARSNGSSEQNMDDIHDTTSTENFNLTLKYSQVGNN